MIANCPHCGKPIASMRPRRPPPGMLSAYETEVLKLWDSGKSVKEIAVTFRDRGVRAAGTSDPTGSLSGSVRSVLRKHKREMRAFARPNAERDEIIYVAHATGATLEQLAVRFQILKERVRQVIEHQERRRRRAGSG